MKFREMAIEALGGNEERLEEWTCTTEVLRENARQVLGISSGWTCTTEVLRENARQVLGYIIWTEESRQKEKRTCIVWPE